jgi:alanine racemase
VPGVPEASAHEASAQEVGVPGVPEVGAPAVLRRHLRPARAEVDLQAIRHNAFVLSKRVAPAQLCAVVKAGGYGHGAVQAATAALSGGASWLAVALVEEGSELREAGIEAPVLVLSEPPPEAMVEVVARRLTPTVYTARGLEAVSSAACGAGRGPFPVHVKVDTGMHRVGASPQEAVAIAREAAARPELELEGF